MARRRHNFNYRYFGGSGGDCTNFASQALKAGGMKYMRAHGHNSPDASTIGTDDFLFGEGSWWSWFTTSTDPDPVTPKEYGSTESFARAPKLFRHLIDYGLAEIVPHNGHIRAGDLVFYNLSGTALDGGPGNELDHTQVVSAVTSKSVWVVQHSPGYRHTLRYVLDERIGGHPGVDFQYWIVHPKYTAANITP